MDVREELLTIAEISIGIAGFSGVIAAFLQRDGLHSLDRVRFVNLFATAFTTLILSFAPIVIAHLGFDEGGVWAHSSAVMVVSWFTNSSLAYLYVVPEISKYMGAKIRYPRMFFGDPVLHQSRSTDSELHWVVLGAGISGVFVWTFRLSVRIRSDVRLCGYLPARHAIGNLKSS